MELPRERVSPGLSSALLGKLTPLGTVIASILYAGMGVGAEAMQRQANLPSSVIFIVQSLIVLFMLASDLLRYYRVEFEDNETAEEGEVSLSNTRPSARKEE